MHFTIDEEGVPVYSEDKHSDEENIAIQHIRQEQATQKLCNGSISRVVQGAGAVGGFEIVTIVRLSCNV